MKLKDIYTNLEKTIDLSSKKEKIFFLKNKLINNIDTIIKKINPTIKLNKKKILKKSKLKNNTDSINKNINKNINLKKIITNQSFIWKIINYFSYKFNINKNKVYIKKTHKLNKNNIIIIILLIILINFILAWLFLILWIQSLKKINNQNYLKNIQNSKLLFQCSNTLFIPYKIIPNNFISNIVNLPVLWIQTTDIIEKYIQIFNQYNKTKLFPTDIIKSNYKNIKETQKNFKKIKNTIWKIKINKNSEYYNYFSLYKNIIYKLDILTDNYIKYPDEILSILWYKKIKKYLILFQNNDELRATWWFPWSVWIISIYKWNIVNFKKEDIYALEWNINKNYKNKLKAPNWINKINPFFTLKDANYYSNYLQSSISINYFLQKWWYNLDWLIFINTNTINKILKEIWWINFKEINTKITANNFNTIISLLVEAKISKQWTLWTPKKILFDFSKLFLDKIKKANKLKLIQILLNDIKNREIAIILFNKNLNNIINKLNLNWNINYKKYINFIYPTFTSLSQNKSDRYLKLDYNITTNKIKNKNSTCNYKTNIILKIKDTFNKKQKEILLNYFKKFNIKANNNLLNIQWEWNNKQYIRFILPKNTLISANNNFTISKNNNSNLIETYTNIKAWNSKTIKISYNLLNKTCNNYNFTLIKQPWIRLYNIKYNFLENWKIIKKLNLINLTKDFYINIEK